MKLSTKLFFLLLVVFVGLFVYAYFASKLPEPLPARHRKTAEVQTPGPSAATPGPSLRVGNVFAYGNALYAVTRIERAGEVQDRGASLTASGSFLLVSVSVTNRGREPLALAPPDFSLADSRERSFTVHLEATKLAARARGSGDLFGEALQPGLGREGVMAFDVPREAAGFSLRVYRGYLEVDLGQ